MQGSLWQEIDDSFHGALAKSPAERGAFLKALSPEVRPAVERLLIAHSTPHQLLDAPPAEEIPAGTRLGTYELLSPIGSGGMGTVYLARRADGQYVKHVAIKVTRQGLFDLDGRFERERRILAQLEHPHIARLLDAGVGPHGQPYLVMDLVEGVTLDMWVKENRPGLGAILYLFEKIADAVSYAHRHLVVHRDLKPGNILVSSDGVPKLVDFGIAKELQEGVTTEMLNLTPRYASPEQIRGAQITTASDIYGLGLVLSEMMAGRHPFEQTDTFAPRIPRFSPTIPSDLAAILGRALREEAEQRYSTVDQFVEDIRRFRQGRPVMAQPESRLYRMRKFVARNRWAVAGASMTAVLLMVAAGAVTSSARQAKRELARANQVSKFIAGTMGILPNGESGTLRAKGASLKVVDLIESVTASLERDLPVESEAQATICYLAGAAYNQIGLYAKAKPLAERSSRLFAVHRPPDDPERVSAEILLGIVQVYLGEFAEAERTLSETRRHWRNPPPYTVAGLESMLGIAQLRLGRTDAARATLEHCLEVMDAGLDGENPWSALAMSNLSLVYQERGEWDRSRQILEKATMRARAQRDSAPEALGWAALNLAVVNRILERPEQVRAAANEAIEAFRIAMGADSPPEAQSLTQLAWAQVRTQDGSAESTARRARAIQAAKLPPGHLDQAVSLTWLGYVLLEKGKLAEARPLLERAIEIRRSKAPHQDWRTAPAALFLAELLARTGEVERGRRMLTESAEQLAKLFGPVNSRVLDAQERLRRIPAR